MKSTFNFWLAGAFALGMAMPAAAQDVTAETVVATVGDQEITIGHMMVARSNLPEQYLQLPDEVLFTGILDQLIQQYSLAQTVSGEPTPALKKALENQMSGFLAGDVLNKIAADAVTEDALKAAYDAAYSDAEPQEEFNASHILVETEEKAKEIKGKIDAGEDFAELAKAESTGPSGPGGGALGWFSEGMMVPEFEAAVLALEAGQVSEPVKTQFGWHVVKLNETRQKDGPPMEAVREQLTGEIQSAAVEAHIAAVTEAATITRSETEIDPAVLKNTELLGE